MPEPVPWQNLSLETSRDEVKSLLQQRPEDVKPPFPDSFKRTEKGFDYFEFIDGYNKSLKSRKYLYILADILTIGLGEIILYPLESNVPQGPKCVAKVCYYSNSKIAYFVVKKDNGEVLKEGGLLAECGSSRKDGSLSKDVNSPLLPIQIEGTNQNQVEQIPNDSHEVNGNRHHKPKPIPKPKITEKVEKDPSYEKPVVHRKITKKTIPSTTTQETPKGMEHGNEIPQ